MNPRNVDVRKGTKGVLSLKVETSLLRLEKLPTFVDIFGFGMSQLSSTVQIPCCLGSFRRQKSYASCVQLRF